MHTVEPFDFFSSWSGGKDSCLALFKMFREGHTCKKLLTVIDETGNHSRSHRLTKDALIAQAKSINCQIEFPSTTWDSYESTFRKSISEFRKQGIMHGVFGDIDLEPHREWVERVCLSENIIAHEPLWLENRRKLVTEFIDSGFKAKIVVVNTKLMSEKFLGRNIDNDLAEELEENGIDACGENGEYHSFVFDGPLFSRPLKIAENSVEWDNEYVFLPLQVT